MLLSMTTPCFPKTGSQVLDVPTSEHSQQGPPSAPGLSLTALPPSPLPCTGCCISHHPTADAPALQGARGVRAHAAEATAQAKLPPHPAGALEGRTSRRDRAPRLALQRCLGAAAGRQDRWAASLASAAARVNYHRCLVHEGAPMREQMRLLYSWATRGRQS